MKDLVSTGVCKKGSGINLDLGINLVCVQELKLMHAIAKLPGHLLDRDGMNGRDNHSDIM